jgi:hypothetical protein
MAARARVPLIAASGAIRFSKTMAAFAPTVSGIVRRISGDAKKQTARLWPGGGYRRWRMGPLTGGM